MQQKAEQKADLLKQNTELQSTVVELKKQKAELEGEGAGAEGLTQMPKVEPLPTEESPRAGAPKASPTEIPARAATEAPKSTVITLDWDSD